MRPQFKIYTVALFGLLALVAIALDIADLAALEPRLMVGVLTVLVLGVVSEYASIPVFIGPVQGSYSILFLFLFASILTFGPAATAVIAVVAHSVSEFGIRKKPAWRALFNIAQQGASAGIAGLLFVRLGGVPGAPTISSNLLPFAGYASTHMLLNLLFVGIAVSLDQATPLRSVVAKLAGPRGANLFYDLLVTPLAVLVAWAYLQFWIWGLAGVVFPILLVRRAYLTNFQLQQANRDLLKALVKAIEIRDPYTSGHSVRVASLAGRVARASGLPQRQEEDIETAALLHDVGKIEAIYSDILKKKGGLTDEEMEIIKSHVEKGVELLTSLSSFHGDVIAAVRHHHERFDGSGYPDGLAGSDIPLGARIIKVCDAVDAMLSDRPYRKALSLEDVKEQLMLFSEREFDPALVSLFFRSNLLEAHAESVANERLSLDQPSAAARLGPIAARHPAHA